MSHRKESPVLEVFHGVLILLADLSPFWADWRLVVAGALVLWLQFAVLKTCVINKYQYGNTEDTFYSRNLRRFNIPHNPMKVKRFFRYYMLLIIPVAAIIWQVGLSKSALLSW